MVADLQWTGGSEMEFIESVDGTRFLIDWNPRFPAWIYGAALAVQINPPLALISAAAFRLFNLQLLDPHTHERLINGEILSPLVTGHFTRTVIEQVNTGVQPLLVAAPSESPLLRMGISLMGKGGGVTRPHPSRNTAGGKLLRQDRSIHSQVERSFCLDRLPSSNDLHRVFATDGADTPLLMFNHESMRSSIVDVKRAVTKPLDHLNETFHKDVLVQFALSIKTNPSTEILTRALNERMIAEAISISEVRAALAAGFSASQIILNGPGKWFDKANHQQDQRTISLLAVIADSATELDQLTEAIVGGTMLNRGQTVGLPIAGAEYVGVRLSVCGTSSRFGADVGDPRVVEQLVKALQRLPVDQKTAFHFHFASSILSIPAWTGAVRAALLAAAQIDRLAGRRCSMLDFGGGWAMNTFTKESVSQPFTDIFTLAGENFPSLSQMIFEPGKAVLQSTGVLITRVLALRESSTQLRESPSTSDEQKEEVTNRIAIVDTSIAHLPDLHSHEHSIAWLSKDHRSEDHWQVLSTCDGNDALYGRICMEHDILARTINLPETLTEGDFLAISSVGAYDTSMAFHFGDATTSVLPLYSFNGE